MSDDKIAFSRRKVLGSLALVGAGSAVTGAGTMALFRDEESISSNGITAGQLDLKSFGDSQAQSLSVGPIHPGESGRSRFPVTNKNNSTILGVLDVTNLVLSSDENGRPEPEREVDGTGGDPGEGNGELLEAMQLRLYVEDDDGNRDFVAGSGDLVAGDLDSIGEMGAQFVSGRAIGFPVAPGESVDFVVDWLLPRSVGNEVMTDDLDFDIEFTLSQGLRANVFDGGSGFLTSNKWPRTAAGIQGAFGTYVGRRQDNGNVQFGPGIGLSGGSSATVSDGSTHSFEVVYNPTAGKAKVTVDGTTAGPYTVEETPTLGEAAIVAKTTPNETGSVTVENVAVDGTSLSPNSISVSDSSASTSDFQTLQIAGVDLTERTVISGDFEITGGSPGGAPAFGFVTDFR